MLKEIKVAEIKDLVKDEKGATREVDRIMIDLEALYIAMSMNEEEKSNVYELYYDLKSELTRILSRYEEMKEKGELEGLEDEESLEDDEKRKAVSPGLVDDLANEISPPEQPVISAKPGVPGESVAPLVEPVVKKKVGFSNIFR